MHNIVLYINYTSIKILKIIVMNDFLHQCI